MIAASDEMEELSDGRRLWCWGVEIDSHDDERAIVGSSRTCAVTFTSV
jgi:hypothetical protein